MQTTVARLTDSAEKFRADPPSGITRPTVTASLLNGHARLSSGAFNWESDLGQAIGGENLAPSPTAYLLGALAGCGAIFLRDTLAPQFGVTLTDVQATASCRADVAGLLGIAGTDPALSEIVLSLRITSPDPVDRVDAMVAAWRERCPIYLALLRPNEVSLDVQVSTS
jgi:uncharacterized OsmC-like protein